MIRVALAGQPNSGKSTIFNMVSGIHQHIANYPGVTVDKKSGRFKYQDEEIEIIDLPGTYSFSSYSLEERVAKEVILYENPDIILNVVDASNLKRNLYLTFQLLEIGKPTIVVLNMMDVAERRGMKINSEEIAKVLGCPVIEASGFKGIGKDEILNTILEVYKNKEQYYSEFKINYEELEPFIEEMQNLFTPYVENISARWLAIKSLEADKVIFDMMKSHVNEVENISKGMQATFQEKTNKDTEGFLATYRYDSSDVIFHKAVIETKKGQKTFTDLADNIVLNRWLSFPILFLIVFLIYELSIVFGYKLTDYTWPILAMIKNTVMAILPKSTLTDVPMITDFGLWMVNSANALLNYIPIFFILFALIAIMEDVGYMPRMAFILDRAFKKFGLHGQSTLPLVLGGAFVGGCAVPGVMSTKGIADDRARMATILTVPLMNCLAKVPFYTLLLGAFFKEFMTEMMFYISTITIFLALIIAKLITTTILRTRETAPFVMELPPYHAPTIKGVVFRATERVYQYIKKVVTIVLAVATILFAMMQFPGIGDEKKAQYAQEADAMVNHFNGQTETSAYYHLVDNKDKLSELLNYYDDYRARKMVAKGEAGLKIDSKFEKARPEFYKFIKPDGDKDAMTINKALRKVSSERNRILRNIKNDKVESSLLGMAGRAMVSVSKYAGFDWKINVAFLSSFAARESAVATLGSLYESNKADSQRAEDAMAENSGYTPLHAVAIIIFMILTPPCIATMMVVKLETHSYRWMLFALFFPLSMGLLVSSTIFTFCSGVGFTELLNVVNITGLSSDQLGLYAMRFYYASVVCIAALLAFIPQRQINWSGGFSKNTQLNIKEA